MNLATYSKRVLGWIGDLDEHPFRPFFILGALGGAGWGVANEGLPGAAGGALLGFLLGGFAGWPILLAWVVVRQLHAWIGSHFVGQYEKEVRRIADECGLQLRWLRRDKIWEVFDPTYSRLDFFESLTELKHHLMPILTSRERSSQGEAMTPRTPGEPLPPGRIRAHDQHGNLWSLDPVAARRDEDPTELTPEQIHRIRAFKQVLAEHDRTSFDNTLSNFRRDRTPEREIQLWERIARVYAQELEARPQANAPERDLLYRALVACSFSANMDDVVAMAPRVKSLSDLDRVVQRFNS